MGKNSKNKNTIHSSAELRQDDPGYDKVKYNIDLLQKDYTLFEDRAKQYFNHLYSIIQFTLVFYGGIFALISSLYQNITDTIDKTRLTFVFLTLYVLPVISYILGLLYFYNLSVLYRIARQQIKIENKITDLAKALGTDFVISRWCRDTKLKITGAMIPYGAMLLFYIVVPIISIIVFNCYYPCTDKEPKLFQFFIPLGVFLLFFIMMCILIVITLIIKFGIRKDNKEPNRHPAKRKTK